MSFDILLRSYTRRRPMSSANLWFIKRDKFADFILQTYLFMIMCYKACLYLLRRLPLMGRDNEVIIYFTLARELNV